MKPPILILVLSVSLACMMPGTGSAQWHDTGEMLSERSNLSATVLNNGLVLIVGGNSRIAELYDPATGTFTPTGTAAHYFYQGHTATLLRNGTVLFVGGVSAEKYAEIYNPKTGLFSELDTLHANHCYHTATLLDDGRVLIAAGQTNKGPQTHAVAEIFHPATGKFSLTDSLLTDRSGHSAVRLPDGKVLLAGGLQTTSPGFGYTLNSCEIYDPVASTFNATGTMQNPRSDLECFLLGNGRVIAIGGVGGASVCEIFDPAAGTWSRTGSLNVLQRVSQAGALLQDGRILVAGGFTNKVSSSAEIYDPVSGTFALTDSMATPRHTHALALLKNGNVLAVGGYDGTNDLKTAEIYTPYPTKVAESPVNPEFCSLYPNYPNPFNAKTRIAFTLPRLLPVTLTLHSLRGSVIRTMLQDETLSGEHRLTWDGLCEDGQPAASGVYLLRLRAGDWQATRKLTLIR